MSIAPTVKYVNVDVVLGFVERTYRRGVPLRVAFKRAGARYGVEPGIIRDFWRSAK